MSSRVPGERECLINVLREKFSAKQNGEANQKTLQSRNHITNRLEVKKNQNKTRHIAHNSRINQNFALLSRELFEKVLGRLVGRTYFKHRQITHYSSAISHLFWGFLFCNILIVHRIVAKRNQHIHTRPRTRTHGPVHIQQTEEKGQIYC